MNWRNNRMKNNKINLAQSGANAQGFVYSCTILQDVTKEELESFAKETLELAEKFSGKFSFLFFTEAEKGFFNLNLETLSIEGKHKNAIQLEKDELGNVRVIENKLVSVAIDTNLTAEKFNTYALYYEQLRKGSKPNEALGVIKAKTKQQESVLIGEIHAVQTWWETIYGARDGIQIPLP